MSEIAIVSSRKVRLEKKSNDGSYGATIALKMANAPAKTLSTIQFYITLLTIIATAYGGTTLEDPLKEFYKTIPSISRYANFLGLATIVVFTTYLSLVIGELVPKTIGLTSAEKTAVIVAPFMQIMGYIATPIVFFLQLSTKIILKLLGYKGNTEPPVTEEELHMMIEQGSQHGVIDESETQMMKGIFRIGDRKVNSLMTHKNDIAWIEKDASEEEIYALLKSSIHSSFPVCEKTLDKIVGIVFIKDIATQIASNKKIDIKKILKQPLFVPETMPALELMEQFRETRVHTGFVMDEYGVVEGIVTFYDILEAIVGELPGSETLGSSYANRRDDGSWLIDGSMQIDEWKELLSIKDMTEKDTGTYNTLGGFMMHQLKRIPKETDSIKFKKYKFEVVDMDGKKVDKVLISLLPNEDQ